MLNLLERLVNLVEYVPILTIPITFLVMKILKIERNTENQERINTILVGIIKELRKVFDNYDIVREKSIEQLRERLSSKDLSMIHKKYDSLTEYVEQHLYAVNGYKHDTKRS